jgi:ABC-2 type transport system permease protein
VSGTGSIYDLGYQRYEGRRLGRAYAFRSLYTHGLAASFGIGRSTRSKVVPMGLFVIALVPVVVELGVTALAGDVVRPVRLDNYFSVVGTVMLLFCAAVAPELVGRDQRNHVLSLYFARALERRDYALAKLAALLTAMLLIALVPELLLYLGTALVRSDPVGYLRDHLDQPGPIVASGMIVSLQVTGVALAIAAMTPRRAYATGGIVAFWFIADGLGSLIATVSQAQTTLSSSQIAWTHYGALLSPSLVADGAVRWFFGSPADGVLLQANLPGWWYVVAALAYGAVGTAVVLRRYARIAA